MSQRVDVYLIGDDDELQEALLRSLEEIELRARPVEIGSDHFHSVEESSGPVFICIGDDREVGRERIATVRRSAPRQVAIAVVARDDDSSAEPWLEAGADDVVFLPIDAVELRARVGASGRVREARELLREKEDDNQLMLELTQALASSLDFEDILYTVVHRIAEVVQVDRCSIILTGVSPLKGYVVASSEDPNIRDLPIDLPKYPEVQKVLKEARHLVIDVGTDPLLDEVRSHIPADGPSTSALFPIMHESRVMGVLFLRFLAPLKELTERELVLCQSLANATAISLRNARFVRALRDEQARISLAHSEAERKVEALSHYADFFESSADGMLVVDAEGSVLYANPRMAALTGLSVQELTTRTLHDLVASEEQSILERLLAGFVRGAYPRGLDLKFNGAFDERVILSVSASSTLRLAQGVLLILRDVTAARAIETELRRTKEFLEALIAQSVDAIIASDMEGRILLFNPAAERVLGFDASEVLGQPMIEEFYPNGVARRIMALLRSKAHGGPGRLEQTRATIRAKDGTEVPISMTGGMIYEYGAPRATFGIFTDLRERLEIENDLARTRLELMEREREAIAAQLAGAAAHELNQPLTSVMASVELLRRRLGEDESHNSMVATIVAETERMARIVRKIGRITHYETTAYVGSTRIIDLDRSAEDSGSLELATDSSAEELVKESDHASEVSDELESERAFRETTGDNEDTDVGRPKDMISDLRASLDEEDEKEEATNAGFTGGSTEDKQEDVGVDESEDSA